MKHCNGCKFACWKTTKTGRLSPTGDGICNYRYKTPALPNSMYWLRQAPTPSGGYINRRKVYDNHCPYYVRED